MGPSRLALATLLLLGCQKEEAPVVRLPRSLRDSTHQTARPTSSQLLWLSQHGKMEQALEGAEELLKTRQLDHAVLEQLGIILLRSGLQSKDQQEQLLTLIGASIAQHESTREILERACHSQHPLVQLHALQGLAAYSDDDVDREMMTALGSPWLPVRLTAAQLLATKRSPHVIVQVEAMLAKLPPQVHPFLPGLLGRVNTPDAMHLLERQLASRYLPVRVAAIEALRAARRDDACPRLREMATHDMGPQAEACAHALASLGDESAIPLLRQMLDSPEMATRLAAACALTRLGEEEAFEMVRQEALHGNPFAIRALASRRGEIELLRELVQHPSLSIRIHAMLGCLEQRDVAALPMLRQLLRAGPTTPVMEQTYTPGHAFSAYRVRMAQAEDAPMVLAMREQLLSQAIELPERVFLSLAEEVLEGQQPELVPLAVKLVENLQTHEAVEMLKRERQRAGAPLSRMAAALALYRMGEPGPWEGQLLSWLREQGQHQIIQLKETPEWDPDQLVSPHDLSAEQTSQLIIEALETLAARQSLQGQLLVMEWLRTGHPRNRFVLAGILMRMAI